MSKLNLVEEEVLETLERLRETLAAGRSVSRLAYLDVMTLVRDAIVKLQNKKYGCMTGLHAGPCSCAGRK
jgi:hypothetical protein